jgi:hypothetical protein
VQLARPFQNKITSALLDEGKSADGECPKSLDLDRYGKESEIV